MKIISDNLIKRVNAIVNDEQIISQKTPAYEEEPRMPTDEEIREVIDRMNQAPRYRLKPRYRTIYERNVLDFNNATNKGK